MLLYPGGEETGIRRYALRRQFDLGSPLVRFDRIRKPVERFCTVSFGLLQRRLGISDSVLTALLGGVSGTQRRQFVQTTFYCRSEVFDFVRASAKGTLARIGMRMKIVSALLQ